MADFYFKGHTSREFIPPLLMNGRGINMKEIEPDVIPDIKFEGNSEFDKFLKEWDVETCECKCEPPLGAWCGTCKICNREEGMIFISEKTGKKYWTDKKDDKYLIPRIPMTEKEKKYGQNWDKVFHTHNNFFPLKNLSMWPIYTPWTKP